MEDDNIWEIVEYPDQADTEYEMSDSKEEMDNINSSASDGGNIISEGYKWKEQLINGNKTMNKNMNRIKW